MKKVVSSIVTFVYLFTQVGFAHSYETGFWSERKHSTVLPVAPVSSFPNLSPSEKPSIKDIYKFSTLSELSGSWTDKNFVFILQDIHANSEAQLSLSQTLQAIDAYTTYLKRSLFVGVEGTSESFSFEKFHLFSQKLVSDMANAFLVQNKISAASHFGLISNKTTAKMFGIDDKTHYDKNVLAFQNSIKFQKKFQQQVASEIKRLNENQQSYVNPALGQFLSFKHKYEQGMCTLAEYLEALKNGFPQLWSSESSRLKNTASFMDVAHLEKKLDFNGINRERDLLFRKLVRLSKSADLFQFSHRAEEFEQGKISAHEFYADLQTLADKISIDLTQFKKFQEYLNYVKKSDGIEISKILIEIASLEKVYQTHLVLTSKEREFVSHVELQFLLSKLSNFSLTSSEWKKLSEFPDVSPQGFFEFYREADIRSEHMVKNLLATKNTELGSSFALVVGGFHSDRIKEILREKGFSYAVLQPRVSAASLNPADSYLSVFSQEKTPLEKMAQGEKLFLSSNKGLLGSNDPASTATGILAMVFLLFNTGSAPVGIDATFIPDKEGAKVTIGKNIGVEVKTPAMNDGADTIKVPGYSTLEVKPQAGQDLNNVNATVVAVLSGAALYSLYHSAGNIVFYIFIVPMTIISAYFMFQALGLWWLRFSRVVGMIRAGPHGEHRLIRYLGYRGAIKIGWIKDYFPQGATPATHPELFSLIDSENPQSLYNTIKIARTVFLNQLDPSLPNKKVVLVNEKLADHWSQILAAPHEFIHYKVFYISLLSPYRVVNWMIYGVNETVAFVLSVFAAPFIFRDVLRRQRNLEDDRLAPDLRYHLKKYVNPFTGGHYTEKDLDFFNGDPEVVHPLLKEETELLGHQDPQAHQIVKLLDLTIVDPKTKKAVSVAQLIAEFNWDLALKAITRAVPPVKGRAARQFNDLILTHRRNMMLNKDNELVGSIPDEPKDLTPVSLSDGPDKIIDLTVLSDADKEVGNRIRRTMFEQGQVAGIKPAAGAGARFSDEKPWVPESLTKALLGVLKATYKNTDVVSSVIAVNLLLWASLVPLNGKRSPLSFLVTQDNIRFIESDIQTDPLIQIQGYKDAVDLSLVTAQSAYPFLHPFGGVLYIPDGADEKLWVRPLGALDAVFTHILNGDFFKWAAAGVKIVNVNAADNITVPDGNAMEALLKSGKPLMALLVDRELIFNFSLELDEKPIAIKSLGFKKVLSKAMSDTVRAREGRSYVYSSIKFNDKEFGAGKVVLRKDGDRYFVDADETHLPDGIIIKTLADGSVDTYHDNNDVKLPKLQYEMTPSGTPAGSRAKRNILPGDVVLDHSDPADVVLTTKNLSTAMRPVPVMEEKINGEWKKISSDRYKLKKVEFEKGGTPFKSDVRDDHEILPKMSEVEADLLRLESPFFNTGELLINLPVFMQKLGFTEADFENPPTQDEILERLGEHYSQVPPSIDVQKDRRNRSIKGHQLAWILSALFRSDLEVMYAIIDRKAERTPGGFFALKGSSTLRDQFENIRRVLSVLIEKLKVTSPDVDFSLLPPYLLAAEWAHVIFIGQSLRKGEFYWEPLEGREISHKALGRLTLNREELLKHSENLQQPGLTLDAGERVLQVVNTIFIRLYQQGYKVFYVDENSVHMSDPFNIQVLISEQPNRSNLPSLQELFSQLEKDFGVQAEVFPSLNIPDEVRKKTIDFTQPLLDLMSDRSIWRSGEEHRQIMEDPIIETPDVMVIFGVGQEKVAIEAARIFVEQKKINPQLKVIIAGGIGRATPESWFKIGSEAQALQKVFLETVKQLTPDFDIKSLEKNDIWLDTSSQNTGQNVQFAAKILRDKGIDPKTVLLIQSPLMQLRALLTWKKQSGFNKATVISYSPFKPDLSTLTDDQLYTFSKLIAGEIERLRDYPEKGFIVPIDLKPRTLEDLGHLKDYWLPRIKGHVPDAALPLPENVILKDTAFGIGNVENKKPVVKTLSSPAHLYDNELDFDVSGLFKDYSLDELIHGKIESVSVWKATYLPTGKKVILKILKKYTGDNIPKENLFRISRFKNEVDFLIRLRDAVGIIIPHFISSGEEDGSLWLTTEPIEGSNLDQWLVNKSDSEKFSAFLKVLESVKALHAVNVIHGGLKPDNLFMANNNEVKILDYETAGLSGNPMEGKYGRDEYRVRQDIHTYEKTDDVFSLGVILFLFATGTAFISGSPNEKMMTFEEARLANLSEETIVSSLSPYWRKMGPVILKATKLNPRDRYQSIPEFLLAIQEQNNRFIQKNTHLLTSLNWMGKIFQIIRKMKSYVVGWVSRNGFYLGIRKQKLIDREQAHALPNETLTAISHSERYKELKNKVWNGILMDVDHTLTDEAGTVPQETIELLVNLLKKGVRVGFASGRGFDKTQFDTYGNESAPSHDLKEILTQIEAVIGENRDLLQFLDFFPDDGGYGFNAFSNKEYYSFSLPVPNQVERKIFVDALTPSLNQLFQKYINKNFDESIGFKSSSITIRTKGLVKDNLPANNPDVVELMKVLDKYFTDKGIDVDIRWTRVAFEIKRKGVNKLKAVEKFSELLNGGTFLSFGDQGNKEGNDYELVSRPGGISLDKFDHSNPDVVSTVIALGQMNHKAFMQVVREMSFETFIGSKESVNGGYWVDHPTYKKIAGAFETLVSGFIIPSIVYWLGQTFKFDLSGVILVSIISIPISFWFLHILRGFSKQGYSIPKALNALFLDIKVWKYTALMTMVTLPLFLIYVTPSSEIIQTAITLYLLLILPLGLYHQSDKTPFSGLPLSLGVNQFLSQDRKFIYQKGRNIPAKDLPGKEHRILIPAGRSLEEITREIQIARKEAFKSGTISIFTVILSMNQKQFAPAIRSMEKDILVFSEDIILEQNAIKDFFFRSAKNDGIRLKFMFSCGAQLNSQLLEKLQELESDEEYRDFVQVVLLDILNQGFQVYQASFRTIEEMLRDREKKLKYA